MLTLKRAAIAAIVWIQLSAVEASNQSSDGLAAGLIVDEGSNVDSLVVLQATDLTPIESLQSRVQETTASVQQQMAEASLSGRKSDQIRVAASAIRGSKALMEEAVTQSEALKAEVQKHIDTEQGWAGSLTNYFDLVVDSAKKALDQFPQMISHMDSMSEEVEMQETQEENRPFEEEGSIHSYRRLLDMEPTESDDGPTFNDDRDSTLSNKRFHEREAQKARQALHRHLEGSPHGRQHLDRVTKFHDGINRADYSVLHQHMATFKLHRGASGGRRLQQQTAAGKKAEQCHLFMQCVGKMSTYDMILYFFSDDIDPRSGDIDDNIYRHVTAPDMYKVYNDANVKKARSRVNDDFNDAATRQWYEAPAQQKWCDDTLQLFFRNVEFGWVPHWEGATVNEVCLAQGSHTYVRLDQIATKVGFLAADGIAEDMFKCSQDLYNSNANPRKSPFPFSREGKIAIDVGASHIEETYPKGGADNKNKLFDNNPDTYWMAREGRFGYPSRLQIRSHMDQCVALNAGDQWGGVHAWGCNTDEAYYWVYEPDTKQIHNVWNRDQCLWMLPRHWVAARACDSGNTWQKWHQNDESRLYNEGADKCLDRYDDGSMNVFRCHTGHNQDFYKPDVSSQDDWFKVRQQPTVRFDIRFANSASHEVKAVEIKWVKHSPCPKGKLSFSAGSSFAISMSAETVEGDVLSQTFLLGSKLTTNYISITCDDPGRRIMVREISVHGVGNGVGSGSTSQQLPQFKGKYAQDFFVPTAVETDSSRDQFGQVKDASVTLYKYEGDGVADGLKKLQLTMQETYRRVYYDWLQHGTDNFRVIVREKHSDPTGKIHQDNADAYMRMLTDAGRNRELKRQMILGFARAIKKSSSGDEFDKRKEEFEEFNQSVIRFYDSVQNGFNMVFGKDASVGYVCGIKEAVSSGGKTKFPGECCLDAPYQNSGGEWGREFDCTMTCKQKAPFFNGLSEESCSAVGGSWCPTPADCSILKSCVNDEIASAGKAKKLAYKAYLEPGKVTNHLDFESCGKSREYFGFDPLYKNDEDICDNIKQLHTTKDFSFLDEVYNQGAPLPPIGSFGGGGAGKGFQPGDNDYPHNSLDLSAWEELAKPDTTWSKSDAVQKELVTKGLLFAVEVSHAVASGNAAAIQSFKCPAEPISGTSCAAVYNVWYTVIGVLLMMLKHYLMTFQYGFDTLAAVGNVHPIQDWEILQAQVKNNDKMYKGMRKVYDGVANHDDNLKGLGDLVASLVAFLGNDDGDTKGKINLIEQKLDCALNPLCNVRRLSSASTPSMVQNAGCDGQDQDQDGVIDNCEEDQYPPEVVLRSTMEVVDDGHVKAVVGKVFQSTEEATDALRGALSVVDDCAPAANLALNLTLKETKECHATVSAAPIHWCNSLANVGVNNLFSFQVDSQPPRVSCGFESSKAGNNKILHLEEGMEQEFFDSGLALHLEDGCSDEVNVEVSVFSNEIDTSGPSHYLTLAEKDRDSTVVVPELWLKQATCGGSASSPGAFCRKSPSGARVYKVLVKATDAAGWSTSDVCHVVVTPSSSQESRELVLDDNAILVGTQRKLESITYDHQL